MVVPSCALICDISGMPNDAIARALRALSHTLRCNDPATVKLHPILGNSPRELRPYAVFEYRTTGRWHVLVSVRRDDTVEAVQKYLRSFLGCHVEVRTRHAPPRQVKS